MGLGKLDILDFGELKTNNVIKIPGAGVGLAASPRLSLLLFFRLRVVFLQKTRAGVTGACFYSRCIY